MVEAYEAYSDYLGMMDLTEDLISTLVREVHGSTSLVYGETTLDFARPWRRMTMEDAVREHAGIDVLNRPLDELARLAAEHGIPDCAKATNQREHLILFFEFFVEERLVQPTFITDFPIELSPLAKRHREKEGFTERFGSSSTAWRSRTGSPGLNDPRDQPSGSAPRTAGGSRATSRPRWSTWTSSPRSGSACRRPAAWGSASTGS